MQKLIIILLSLGSAAMLAAALYLTFTDYPANQFTEHDKCPISHACE